MSPQAVAAAIEFLQHYPRDAQRRWSATDREAQQVFVSRQVGGRRWLDWSTAASAVALFQASLVQTPVTPAGKWPALILAGPAVELLAPRLLFDQAAAALDADGVLAGILPCLRDNSPESQQFSDAAAAGLWPYHTAEEWFEALRDAGWRCGSEESRFVPIPQFNRAVLNDELGFKGFHRIFVRLEADGYDPMEVGWGELRLVARLA